MIPFSNWLVLFFLHFAFLFFVARKPEQKPVLSRLSCNLVIIYFCLIATFSIEKYFSPSTYTVFLTLFPFYTLLFYFSQKSIRAEEFENINPKLVVLIVFLGIAFAIFTKNLFDPLLYQDTVLYFTKYGKIIAFVFWCLLPAMFEEFFFRSYIFDKLSNNFSKNETIIISSFLFVLMHFVYFPINSFIYLSVLGVILGFIKIKYEKIFYCIIFHLTYNFFVLDIF